MDLKFKGGDNQFMEAIAKSIGSRVENGRIELPNNLGTGYIKGIVIGDKMRMMVRNYQLKEDVRFEVEARLNEDVVMIAFHNVFKTAPGPEHGKGIINSKIKILPSVQITSSHFGHVTHLSAQTKHSSIIIAINK